MVLYNITELKEAETLTQLLSFANNASEVGGIKILSVSFVLAIFFITLMSFREQDFEINIAISSFISLVISGILSFGGFLPLIFPLAFLIMLAFAMFYIYTKS